MTKRTSISTTFILIILGVILFANTGIAGPEGKPRVIITSDGEIDDECSMVPYALFTKPIKVIKKVLRKVIFDQKAIRRRFSIRS